MTFKTAYITVIITIVFSNNLHAQKTATFKDKRDKKKYTTVKIGNQIFMAQNLAYKPTFGLFWNGFENEDSLQIYGYFYDWKTAQSVCPSGWHLPSTKEWDVLINYLGGRDIAGKYLKEVGYSHWNVNDKGDNKSGFTGFPSGYYIQEKKTFVQPSNDAEWWSSTESSTTHSFTFSLQSYNEMALLVNTIKTNGYPIRCIKD